MTHVISQSPTTVSALTVVGDDFRKLVWQKFLPERFTNANVDTRGL
jgi:hypothetical protein